MLFNRVESPEVVRERIERHYATHDEMLRKFRQQASDQEDGFEKFKKSYAVRREVEAIKEEFDAFLRWRYGQ